MVGGERERESERERERERVREFSEGYEDISEYVCERERERETKQMKRDNASISFHCQLSGVPFAFAPFWV